jgi:hypothetical protein
MKLVPNYIGVNILIEKRYGYGYEHAYLCNWQDPRQVQQNLSWMLTGRESYGQAPSLLLEYWQRVDARRDVRPTWGYNINKIPVACPLTDFGQYVLQRCVLLR